MVGHQFGLSGNISWGEMKDFNTVVAGSLWYLCDGLFKRKKSQLIWVIFAFLGKTYVNEAASSLTSSFDT
jgi:hypothetical protein